MSQIENEDFTFHYERLDEWLHRKFSELTLVKKIIQNIETKIGKKECLFFPSPEALTEKMTNPPVEFGFKFTFSSITRPEEFLERLKRPVIGTDIFKKNSKGTNNVLNDKHWYESSSVFERIQSEIVVFVKLVKRNTNKEKFTFAITATDKYDKNRVNQFPIIVHHKQETLFRLSAMKFCNHILKDVNQLAQSSPHHPVQLGDVNVILKWNQLDNNLKNNMPKNRIICLRRYKNYKLMLPSLVKE